MGNGLNLEDVNLDKLAELHKNAKELSYDCIRNTKKLEILTEDALFIEDVINCDPREPMTMEDLDNKFEALSSQLLVAGRRKEIKDAIFSAELMTAREFMKKLIV